MTKEQDELYDIVSELYFKFGLFVTDKELDFLISIGAKLKDSQSLSNEEFVQLEILFNKYVIADEDHRIGELIC